MSSSSLLILVLSTSSARAPPSICSLWIHPAPFEFTISSVAIATCNTVQARLVRHFTALHISSNTPCLIMTTLGQRCGHSVRNYWVITRSATISSCCLLAFHLGNSQQTAPRLAPPTPPTASTTLRGEDTCHLYLRSLVSPRSCLLAPI